MPPVPIDIAIGFTFLPVAVAALLSIVFVRLSRSLWRIVAIMAGWAGLTAIMAQSGILAAFNSRFPWIPLLVLTQLAIRGLAGLVLVLERPSGADSPMGSGGASKLPRSG